MKNQKKKQSPIAKKVTKPGRISKPVALPSPLPKKPESSRPKCPPVVPLSPEEKAAKAKASKEARMYFNAGTQEAIVAFQIADKAGNLKERDRLYVKGILPAFQKLVENLINIHKFTSLFDTYDDLKNDCITFLYETLHKFDSSRGTNAFSYFNVVSKNYLIIRTKQKTQRVRRSVSLDDPDALSVNEQRILEDHNMIPGQDVLLENESSARIVMDMLYEIRSKVKTENELACANSILTIFENIDDIDLLTKSALLLYMRELSCLTPKQLTTAIQSIKRQYRCLKLDPKFKLF
jgi:hypothetical protein